jgi:mycothiol system anti-sigma-R factor
MSCEQTRSLVHGYLDGELDAARAVEFETHLENCPVCVKELEAQESLRASLRQAQLYENAPATFRKNTLAALRRGEEQAIGSRRTGWQWLAAAAVILLVVYTGWRVAPGLLGGEEQAAIAAQMVDAHLRSLQPGHLTDVVSTDQHTVKPWFDGKLDFSPPVKDLAGDGFPLQGGRLDVLHGRSVAALVYGRRKHVISVFIWPASQQGAPPRSGSLQGYNWVAWQNNGMEFCAVSDVASADLDQLRSLLSQ